MKRNCNVGDLAITVRAELPQNIGNIVKILAPKGYGSWWGFARRTFQWEVEISANGANLNYEIGNQVISKTIGLVPDACLRPILPASITAKASRKKEVDPICLVLLDECLVSAANPQV